MKKMKKIIITGASTGLGLAIARQFAAAGYRLILISKTADKLKSAAESLKSYQVPIDIYPTDLSVKENIQVLAETLMREHDHFDILVNNAGRYVPGSIYNEPDGQLEQMINTNLYSAYHFTRGLMPAFLRQQHGHIFNMCSIASLQAYPNGGSYSISKYALAGFTRNLREELKPLGIKVTGIYPGATFTDSWKGSGVSEERIMQASDIAQLVFTAANLSPQACTEDIIIRPQLGDL